jgi:hypothetical protein
VISLNEGHPVFQRLGHRQLHQGFDLSMVLEWDIVHRCGKDQEHLVQSGRGQV